MQLGCAAPLVVCCALAAGTARAWQPPPAPTRWVTDGAGFLSVAAAQELDRRLATYERSSGHQILLWIGRSTGGVPLEDWAARTFAAWRVGRKGIDDGVVIFLLTEDRRIRIEVGYGLEEKLPDARAASIIRDVMTPRIARGDRDGAARAAVDQIATIISGPDALGGAAEGEAPDEGIPDVSWGEIAAILAGCVLFAILLRRYPGLATYLLMSWASRGGAHGDRGRGASWHGSGGFRGGGGRSGGGGASGSW